MPSNVNRRRFLKSSAALGGVGLTGLAGCLGDDDVASPDALMLVGFPEEGAIVLSDYYDDFEGEVDIIVPDGLQDPELPDAVGRSLEGISGTAPGAAGPQSDAFADHYEDAYGRSPGIFNAHTFDASALLILANAAAGENDGNAIQEQFRRIANPGGEVVGPEDMEEAAELAAEGADIQYQGASTVCEFDGNGDPVTAAYDVWEYVDDDDPIVVQDTLEFDVGDPEGPAADEGPGGFGRTIEVGILLPESGALAPVGGPMIDAGMLAADLINDGGLDLEVDVTVEDTETDADTTQVNANAMVDAGIPAICGAAASDSSIPFAENIVADRNVVGCSPSSTAPAITDLDANDKFFRTAPSDVLQGPAMAEVVFDEMGHEVASTLYRDDDYGIELSEQFSAAFEEMGGEIAAQVSYDPDDASFFSPLDEAINP